MTGQLITRWERVDVPGGRGRVRFPRGPSSQEHSWHEGDRFSGCFLLPCTLQLSPLLVAHPTRVRHLQLLNLASQRPPETFLMVCKVQCTFQIFYEENGETMAQLPD